MSKRHYFELKGGLPNPDTDPDCIFYAPLTEGDLTDHKSGISWVPMTKNGYQPGTATWDANMSAYKFYRQGGNAGQAGQWSGLSLGLNLTSWGFTSVITMACVDNRYAWTERSLMIGGYAVDSTGKYSTGANSQLVPKAQDVIPPLTNTFYTMVTVYPQGGGTGVVYMDGVQSYTEGCRIINRSGATNALLLSQVAIGKDDNNQQHQTNVWCKDIRIYNRVLTQAEIQQL